MNKNKIMLSGIVFVVVFSLLFGYKDMLVTQQQALNNAFSFELSFTIAILSALFVFALSYGKEDDSEQHRFEFIRSHLNEDELSRIDGLDDESKRVAYEIHFNDFSYQQILECRNYVNQNKTKTNKFTKLGVLSAIVLA